MIFLTLIQQHLIETQLALRSSSDNYILDSKTPLYLDLTLFFVLNWCASFDTTASIFKTQSSSDDSPFRLTLAWLDQVRTALQQAKERHPQKGVPERINADVAARRVLGARSQSQALLLDRQEPLLVAGWFSIGDEVEVTPNDTGRVPQKGKLVAVNAERSVIEVKGDEGRTVRVHAPRIGFDVKRSKVKAKV